MATMNNYKAEFVANSFVPGVDISDAYWAKAVSEAVLMQNLFSEMSNQVIGKLNDNWHKYEGIKAMDQMMGSQVFTEMCWKAMDIDANTTYIDWIEKYFKEICNAVDTTAAMNQYMVRSNLFRDGDLLVFGVKFVNKPEWTIDLRLRQVD